MRFPVQAEAMVWPEGSDRAESLETITTDISRAGLSFRGNIPQEPGSLVRFEVRLPSPIEGGPAGVLTGQGLLIRKDALDKKQCGFAAKIERYQLRPVAGRSTQGES